MRSLWIVLLLLGMDVQAGALVYDLTGGAFISIDGVRTDQKLDICRIFLVNTDEVYSSVEVLINGKYERIQVERETLKSSDPYMDTSTIILKMTPSFELRDRTVTYENLKLTQLFEDVLKISSGDNPPVKRAFQEMSVTFVRYPEEEVFGVAAVKMEKKEYSYSDEGVVHIVTTTCQPSEEIIK